MSKYQERTIQLTHGNLKWVQQVYTELESSQELLLLFQVHPHALHGHTGAKLASGISLHDGTIRLVRNICKQETVHTVGVIGKTGKTNAYLAFVPQ